MCLSINSRRKTALSPLCFNEIPFILPMSSRVGEFGGTELLNVGVVLYNLFSLQREDLRQQLSLRLVRWQLYTLSSLADVVSE